MAGFGRTLVRGLGAAMQGYGKTLTDQAEEQRRERQLDGALMRERALADYKQGLTLQTIGATAAANVASHDATAQIDTREAEKRLGPATDARIRTEAAKIQAEADAEYRLLPAKTRATLTIEEYRQNRLDARESLDRASREGIAARDRDEKVVATGVDGAGNVVVTKGNDSHVTFRGMRPTPRGGADSEGGGDLASLRGGGAAPAPAAPAPVDHSQELARDKAHLAMIYPNATPETYPGLFRNGRKIPLTEAANLLEQQYGS